MFSYYHLETDAPPIARSPRKGPLTGLVIFFLFAAIASGLHYKGFHSPMIYDSRGIIADSEHLFASHDPARVLELHPGRPVFMLSLYLNYRLFGMDPFWFRVVNVLFLAGEGVALVWLSTVVLGLPQLRVPGNALDKRAVSLALGLLFTVHPLQTFTLLYIWQRAAGMACLFYFAALGVYLSARSGRFRDPTGAYVGTATLFAAAMLSKENPASFPAVLALAEVTLLGQGLRQALKRLPGIALIAAPAVVLYVLFLHGFHGPESGTPKTILERVHEYYRMGGQTPIQMLLTQCRMFGEYLAITVAPFECSVDLFRANVISTSLWDPPGTFVGCAAAIGVTLTGLAMIRKAPVVSFGLLFFVGALIPESLFMPKYTFFAYRPVLSMGGLLLVGGWAALQLLDAAARASMERAVRALTVTAFAIYVVCLGWQTVGRAQRWDPVTFWRHEFLKLPPYSSRVEKVAYLDVLTNFTGLLNHSSVDVKPIDVLGHAWPGKIVPGSGGLDAGIESLISSFPDFTPRVAKILVNLGSGLKRYKDVDGAVKLYEKAVMVDPSLPQAYLNLGLVLADRGDHAGARERYAHALRLNPNLAAAHFLTGTSFLTTGDLDQAISSLNQALRLRPYYRDALANLGVALVRAGRASDAVPPLEKALSVASDDADLHFTLGVALARSGHVTEAVRHFRRVLAIRPEHAGARENIKVLEGPAR